MKGNALLHFIRFILNLDSAQTQTSDRERAVLKKYISTAKTIAEIGVFEGVNTGDFALYSPEAATVFAIDPFFKGSLRFNYGKYIALKDWRKKGIISKIQIIEGFSWDVINQIPSYLDFIFIDGDHSFKGVCKDFEMYSKKLSPHGIIALHDARLFDNGWTESDWGPVRLVEEVIKPSGKWTIVDQVDSLVLIKMHSA